METVIPIGSSDIKVVAAASSSQTFEDIAQALQTRVVL